jgi:hypothetical protein
MLQGYKTKAGDAMNRACGWCNKGVVVATKDNATYAFRCPCPEAQFNNVSARYPIWYTGLEGRYKAEYMVMKEIIALLSEISAKHVDASHAGITPGSMLKNL